MVENKLQEEPHPKLIKEGPLLRRVGYFPTYQKVFCVLYEDGILECRNVKTHERVDAVCVKNCVLSTLRRRKRDILMNDDRQMLSIYRKDFRLLMCLVADDTESARNWQSAFGKVMKTSAKNYIPIYQTQEGNGALEKDEEVSSNSGVGEFRVSDELNEKLKLHKKLVWRTLGVTDGVRVMHEVKLTKLYLCLRVSCVMRGSPKEVLDMIQYHELEWDENLQSVEVIEEVGPNCRIEHVKRHPEVFGPFTASPRDSVLKRFWGKLDNGVYALSQQSAYHEKASVSKEYVREKIFMTGYLIIPSKSKDEEYSKVILMLHMDPKGWLGKMPRAIAELWFRKSLVIKLLSLRDAMEEKRFVDVDIDTMVEQFSASQSKPTQKEIDRFKSALKQDSTKLSVHDVLKLLAKEGSMNPSQYSGTPLHDMPLRVRGKNYLNDRKKILCCESVFELIAVDLFETQKTLSHIAARSDNLVHQFEHDFTFILHFQVPGPPYLSFVCYFVAPKNTLTLDTPFGILLHRFLTGTDEFRDQTLKIIPRAIDPSPWVVKRGVGETPAILGKKLKQRYFGDGETYFEVDIDVSSSRIAAGVLSLVKGYASTVAIDLGFVLEAKRKEELPEKILGAIRLQNPIIEQAKPLL